MTTEAIQHGRLFTWISGVLVTCLLAHEVAGHIYKMHSFSTSTILAGALSACVFGQSATYPADAATYTNPVLEEYGADPWVVRSG